MGTWAGAIVQTRDGRALSEIAARYGITVENNTSPWTLVEANVALGSLVVPPFAEALSRELEGVVVGFFVQTTASIEEVEHWDNGRLLRKLAYSGDEGGWITQHGRPQDWEPTLFFAHGEGTGVNEQWPQNLRDEITDEDVARYEKAKSKHDASSIMDLLEGGAAGSIQRLCGHFTVDPRSPGAHYTPPTNWKPRIVVFVALAFMLGMFLLGALTS